MSDTIRKFNRFELKYILSLKQAEELKKDFANYINVDSNGGKNGKYTLASLYYDTQDYRFYREKIEGLKFRRKVRIRRYVDEKELKDDSIVFLEIKQRVDRVTQKRRVPMKYVEVLNLIENEIIPDGYQEHDLAVINEVLNMVKTYNLKPSAITTYNRQAFFGKDADIGLRITFDTDVCFKQKNLDLAVPHGEGFMLDDNFCIMEIKANEKIPYWITELVASHNIKLVRISKYCQALESAGIYDKSLFNFTNWMKK